VNLLACPRQSLSVVLARGSFNLSLEVLGRHSLHRGCGALQGLLFRIHSPVLSSGNSFHQGNIIRKLKFLFVYISKWYKRKIILYVVAKGRWIAK
jgi:hypothetical protein